MTPERLNELADWLTQSSTEELLDDIDNVAAISEFLRECAKAEPVAYISHHMSGLYVSFEPNSDAIEVTPLYTAPQVAPVVPDEKSESMADNNFSDWAVQYAKGWNDCRAAMLKGEK